MEGGINETRGGMVRGFWLAGMAAALLSSSAWAGCATPEETQAFNVRALKSSLMVAALSCNQQTGYNGFIARNRSLFSGDGHVVQGYFRRMYGGAAETQLNRFITRMANDASQTSMKGKSEDYCAGTQKFFHTLSAMNQQEVLNVSSGKTYAALHGVRPCAGAKKKDALAMNARGVAAR
jgi:hypothetical protein